MPQLVPMDPKVALKDQLGAQVAPVVLVNKFEVEPELAEAFVASWALEAAFMKRQPGCLSVQLHRGIAGSSLYLNYAVWESTEHFRAALMQPEFQALLAKSSATTASPHLFEKVAVPGICEG